MIRRWRFVPSANTRDEKADAAYWRNAYEMLVKQTGRDLNDGLGPDPRALPRAPSGDQT